MINIIETVIRNTYTNSEITDIPDTDPCRPTPREGQGVRISHATFWASSQVRACFFGSRWVPIPGVPDVPGSGFTRDHPCHGRIRAGPGPLGRRDHEQRSDDLVREGEGMITQHT